MSLFNKKSENFIIDDAFSESAEDKIRLYSNSLEINLVKADIEKRLQEKDEEFESTRRNHTKAMEQMQFAIEQESKSKAEAVRIKKKLELNIGELDSVSLLEEEVFLGYSQLSHSSCFFLILLSWKTGTKCKQ